MKTFKAGDKVKFVHDPFPNCPVPWMELGEIYEVLGVDYAGQVALKRDNGEDSGWFFPSRFELVKEAIVEKKLLEQYGLKAGDVIVHLGGGQGLPHPKLVVEDELVVVDATEHNFIVRATRFGEEFEYAPIRSWKKVTVPKKPEPKFKFKKGDRVICVEPNSNLEEGKSYVMDCDYEGDARTHLVAVKGIDDTFYAYRFQLAKPASTFSKSQLVTGMRVIYRDGSRRVVGHDGRLVGPDGKIAADLKNWKDDLTKMFAGEKQLDIVAVYEGPEKLCDFYKLDLVGVQLFERVEESPQQKELKEIEQKLKELQDKAAALRSKL